MYTLYHFNGACSDAVVLLIKALGVECDIREVDIMSGAQFSPEFLAVNPKGQVPALVDGDFVLTELPAIMLYLCDKAGDNRWKPAAGSQENARMHEWLNYIATNLHALFSHIFMPQRYSTDENAGEGIAAAATEKWQKEFAAFADQLSGDGYLCGAQPTLADLYLHVVFGWDAVAGLGMLERYPVLQAYRQRVAEAVGVQ